MPSSRAASLRQSFGSAGVREETGSIAAASLPLGEEPIPKIIDRNPNYDFL